MNTKQKAVDVLAVLDDMIETRKNAVVDFRTTELSEARTAVAELITVLSETQDALRAARRPC